MSQTFKALIFTLVATTCISWCNGVVAAPRHNFKVGDRVEVESFGKWLPGKVTEARDGSVFVAVLLDKPDVSPEFAARVSKKSLQSFREKRTTYRKLRASKKPVQAPPVEKPRKWTSKDGKFGVIATFVELANEKVGLQKKDGKRVDVPLTVLSSTDVFYAKRAAKRLEAAAETPPAVEGGPAVVAAAPELPSIALQTADRSKVRSVSPQTFSEWSFQPKSKTLPTVQATHPTINLQTIEGSTPVFEDFPMFRVSADGNRAIVVRKKGEVSQEAPRFLELVDLKLRKSTSLIPMPKLTKVLDIDLDSGCVAYGTAKWGFGQNTDLFIAKLEGKQLKTIARWQPHSNATHDHQKDVKHVWLLDSSRVMTLGQHGDLLTVWDTSSAQAVLEIPVKANFSLSVGLSPDRTLLAVALKNSIAIIDLGSGTHVATIPNEKGKRVDSLSFRADNQRLAVRSDTDMEIRDLTNGKSLRTFSHMALRTRGEMIWTGDFLLVNNQYLFDIDRRILLWQYDHVGGRLESARHNGTFLQFVSKASHRSAPTFGAITIPHAGAFEMAKSLGSPESLLAINPGDAVKIIVDLGPGVGNPQTVRDAVAANVKKAGLVVADEAALVLTAVCKPQKTQTITLTTRGGIKPTTTEKTITPHASALEMTLNGKRLYRIGAVAEPHMTIYTKPDESLDQALRRLTSPNLQVLTDSSIPTQFARPGTANANGAYGISSIKDSNLPGSTAVRFE